MLTRLLFITSFLLLLVSAPVLAATDTNDKIFSVCKNVPTSTICKDRSGQNQDPNKNPVNHMINVAASIVALATGIAAVIFIILGGLTMVTSGGNAEAVTNARRRILYAVIGLVVVALAWTIITFLTDRLIKT